MGPAGAPVVRLAGDHRAAGDDVLREMADAKHGDLCPMCGHTGPHNHTPREVTIWRNGIKLGASLAKPHFPNEGKLMFGGDNTNTREAVAREITSRRP